MLSSQEYRDILAPAGAYDASVWSGAESGARAAELEAPREVLKGIVKATRVRMHLKARERTPLPHDLDLTTTSVQGYDFLLDLKGSIYPIHFTNDRQYDAVIAVLMARQKRRELALPFLYRNPLVRELVQELIHVLEAFVDEEFMATQGASAEVYTRDWSSPKAPADSDPEPTEAELAVKVAKAFKRLKARRTEVKTLAELEKIRRRVLGSFLAQESGEQTASVAPAVLDSLTDLLEVSPPYVPPTVCRLLDFLASVASRERRQRPRAGR